MPEDDDDEFFDAGSAAVRSPSTSPEPELESASRGGRKGSEVDTEEDVEAPITPGPNRGSFPAFAGAVKGKGREGDEEGDIEDDWVDPITPISPPPVQRASSQSSVDEGVQGGTGERGVQKRKTKKRRGTRGEEVRTPQPAMQQQHFPFPVSMRQVDEVEPMGVAGGHRRVIAPTVTQKRAPQMQMQMRAARAKDGGRTQSGGVRAIPTDDGDDF